MNKLHQSVQKGNKCIDLELKDHVIQQEFGRTAFYNAVKYFIMKLNNVTFSGFLIIVAPATYGFSTLQIENIT